MMKAKVITLGCKVNQYESEAMLSSLLQHGFAAAEDKETADVVILNSCTLRRTRTTKNLRISMWRTLQAARVHL